MNKKLITFVYFLADKTDFRQSFLLKNDNNHDDVNNIDQKEKKSGVTNGKVLSSKKTGQNLFLTKINI